MGKLDKGTHQSASDAVEYLANMGMHELSTAVLDIVNQCVGLAEELDELVALSGASLRIEVEHALNELSLDMQVDVSDKPLLYKRLVEFLHGLQKSS